MQKILRKGLLTTNQNKRNSMIQELRNNFPLSQDRYYVETALKDFSTTIDDFEDVINGEHYQKYMGTNVKSINENFLNPEVAKMTEDKIAKIKISDTYGEYNNLEINNVDIDKLAFPKTGNAHYGGIDDGKSNKKIMKALAAFNLLTERDKKDIKESIQIMIETAKRNKDKQPDKKAFIDAINEQLDDTERDEFMQILLTQVNNTYTKSI